MSTLLPILLVGSPAQADPKACDGPIECCPAALAEKLGSRVDVQLGVMLVGLYNVDEKRGTWDADYYLTESWPATPGFSPMTEIVNEIYRQPVQFDNTWLHGRKCTRSRRVHSTLRSGFNMRAFPFDRQRLMLELSDAEFPASDLGYASRASVADVDDEAREQLSSWKIDGNLGFNHAVRFFNDDGSALPYDYATFSLPVRRHVTFHLTKFFLPLLVIMAVAFTVFWIHPGDLSSKVAVGVTCLLAAIAFQLAEAGTLPEVAYLTLADRIYAICYIALAVSLMIVVFGNSLLRRGRELGALKVDRVSRIAFPAVLLAATALAVARAFTQ